VWTHDIKRLLLAAVLEFAALTGVQLRPKDIDAALKGGSQLVAQEQSRDHAVKGAGEDETS
jgi:hypothetical protein